MATVTIQKRKRKDRNSYIVGYWNPMTGQKVHFKTFQKRRQALQAANELRYLIDSGRLPDVESKRNRLRLLTFSETVQHLQEEWAGKLAKGSLRERTLPDYQCMVDRLCRRLGDRLLSTISKRDVQDLQDALYSRNSAVTSNRYLFILKQVFRKGIEIGAIFEDSTVNVPYLSERDHERNRFLLPDELSLLVEASRRTRAKHYLPALIHLGAEHGTSKQEALSQRWVDIEFDYKGLGIVRFFRTKNGHEGTEHLMPRTKEALLAWKEHLALSRLRRKVGRLKTDFVFSRLDGTPIKRFDNAWRSARSRAGMEDLHFHNLRHTFCSNLILSGSDLKDVKEMIGHRDLAMTDRYTHLTIQHKLMRQERLNRHYTDLD